MERGIPRKSDEEQRLLLRDLGLIIAAGVPTFPVSPAKTGDSNERRNGFVEGSGWSLGGLALDGVRRGPGACEHRHLERGPGARRDGIAARPAWDTALKAF